MLLNLLNHASRICRPRRNSRRTKIFQRRDILRPRRLSLRSNSLFPGCYSADPFFYILIRVIDVRFDCFEFSEHLFGVHEHRARVLDKRCGHVFVDDFLVSR